METDKKIISSINDVRCCIVSRLSIVPYCKKSKYCRVLQCQWCKRSRRAVLKVM